MTRTAGALLGGALALAGTMPAPPALADTPPRGVPAYDCRSLAATTSPADIWWTRFDGERRDVFDNIDAYHVTACFLSEADCKAWLYWTQSDFPYHMVSTPCRRGL
jgi:hypothetical protein